MPGSKPIWFTEYGCPAIDKGTNQPNRFVDVKSSESGLPARSNGHRDDLIQMQYLLAVNAYWSIPANNPISGHYQGPMVDLDHAHVWAWDARPFPEFPGLIDVWNDGDNYSRGHWVNGRATNQPLGAVVAELCQGSGVESIDTEQLYGLVRGFQQPDLTTGRAALQPLMLAYGFDSTERDGKIRFRNRNARIEAELTADDFAIAPDIDGDFETTRAPDAEMTGQVRIGFVESQASYEVRSAEVRFPDEEARGVSQTDLPLALTRNEALATVERWLAEARVARDGARFALPKSRLLLGAGDVVRAHGQRYRIDRVELAEAQVLEAVRVERGVYLPASADSEVIVTRSFSRQGPVFPVFLDLPLLTGEEVPHAPHVAVTASPWPGTVGVWAASQDSGCELNRLISASATIGITETALSMASPGIWDRGAPLRIRLSDGELASVDQLGVLNGANVMAIGDGSSENWEIFQFAEAQLVAPMTYELATRLRGQLGTDGLMPAVWPAGSTVVLLDLALQQLDLPLSALGLSRHYRIGAAARGNDDLNASHRVEAFGGAGLRPYPVAHLRSVVVMSGDHQFSWKRRTRIGGDSWLAPDVPLGEETQSFVVRVIQGPEIKAEYSVAELTFTHTPTMRSSAGIVGAYRVEVAQISAHVGPGPVRVIEIPA